MRKGDWNNAAGFRESPQQASHAKPQWSANRRRSQNNKNAQEPPTNRATAPAPAPWQAPSSFQAPQGQPEGQGQGPPVAVNLQDLPYTLCRQNLLEAMLDQAGLAGNMTGCILGQDQDMGKALIYLTDRISAQKCAAHFHGCSWGNNGPPVTAQLVEGAGVQNRQADTVATKGPDKSPGGKTRSARNARHGKLSNAKLPCAKVEPATYGFADTMKNGSTSDEREQVSTDAGDSRRSSWESTESSFYNYDTDDGF